MKHFSFLFRGLSTVSMLLSAFQAIAAEKTWPRIEGAVAIEVQNDGAFNSDAAGNERNDLFTKVEPEATLHLVPGLALFAKGVLEPVRGARAGEDRFFEDHGFFIEDIWLSYEKDWAAIKGGKFTPNFGVAWDRAPGIYGDDFATDGYELTERIGFEGRATFGNETFGKHSLAASTFFLDTSVLAHTALQGRGTRGREDGGVSNTEDFSSFAASLDGGDVGGVSGLSYHLGFVRQKQGRDGTKAERGVAAALYHEKIALAPELSLMPLVEFVRFSNFGGMDGRSRRFITGSGQFFWRHWNLALSATSRRTEAADNATADDFLFQVSAGYAFDFGLKADVGWRHVNEDSIQTNTFGALLTYNYEF